jgi:hypothetical protein
VAIPRAQQTLHAVEQALQAEVELVERVVVDARVVEAGDGWKTGRVEQLFEQRGVLR